MEEEQALVDSGRLKESTFKGKIDYYKFWQEVLQDRNPYELGRAEVRAIHKTVLNLPKSARKVLKLSHSEAFDLAKTKHNYPKQAANTQNNYIRAFKSILDFCYQQGIHNQNLIEFFKSQYVDKENSPRQPFTTQEVRKIIDPVNLNNEIHGSTSVQKQSRFWIPLIGAYSGMRLEEIAQLTPQDVVFDKEFGILYFNLIDGIRPDGTPHQIKNKTSHRAVPVHSKLIDLGFREFLERKLMIPNQSLFDLQLVGSETKYGKNMQQNGFL